MDSTSTQVAVIGAGPNGLSVATHLRHRGLAVRAFGPPMSFWLRMPATINLKSFAWATNVAAPRPHFTYQEYCRAHGLQDVEPCSMASFAEYGLWAQRELVPDVVPTQVAGLRACGDGFELGLPGGETVRARRVVIATGLSYFENMPKELRALPPALASHTAAHTDYSVFAGKSVAVLGAGASAVEAAALVQEAGGRSLLLAREKELVFHTKLDAQRPLREKLRAPNSVLGPGRKSWVLEHFPPLLHYVPEARRVRFTHGYLGAAGPWWLRDRFFGKVAVQLRSRVTGAVERGGKVCLDVVEDGKPGARAMEFDHVIAWTGFVVDVDRIPFLDAALRARIRRIERSPALSRVFESSVRGLYFVGPAAALSFGPLFRFVTGASYAAPTVARHAARELGC
jgi:cation diffusion facilitator CzcD-associated flavoprotein CzcO